MPRHSAEYQEILDEHIVQRTMSMWRKRKKPPTLKVLNERIDEYFAFCDENSLRPGTEGLAQCIGVVNKTLVRWSQGLYCTPEWASVCAAARQTINAYYEIGLTSGTMPTIAAIFALKATAGWSDQESFDAAVQREMIGAEAVPYATPMELMEKYTNLLESHDVENHSLHSADTDSDVVYVSATDTDDRGSI